MIHSTAGGKLKDYNYYDYAKVVMLEGEKADSILLNIIKAAIYNGT